MKKNGFAFIETIITVVILSASLIFIYSSYNAVINEEEKRIYYDDVAYIYKTNYVKRFLQEYSEIESIKNYAFPEHTYIVTIGAGYDALFKDSKMNNSLESIINNFHINQMILLKSQMFDDCVGESDYCNQELEKLSYNMRSYVNTLDETDFSYYLVVEYAEKYDGESSKYVKCTPGIDTNCTTYYVSLGVESKNSDEITDDICKENDNLSDCIKSQFTTQGSNNLYHHDGTLENGINDDSYRYAGSYETTNNWVCFGSNTTPCPYDNLYRIIGVFNNQVKLIKAYEAGENVLGKAPDGISNGNYVFFYKGILSESPCYAWSGSTDNFRNIWTESTLNTETLNGTYLNKLGIKWTDKIANTEWQIAGNTSNYITSTPAKTYEYEILKPDISTTYENKTIAKIGLMYVSDYGFAASPVNWKFYLGGYGYGNLPKKNTNWISLGIQEYTITKYSNYITSIYFIGYPSYNKVGAIYGNRCSVVRPTFYLNEDVKYLKGVGTENRPIFINN